MPNDETTVVPQDETQPGQPPAGEGTPGEGEGAPPAGTTPPKAEESVTISPAEFRHYKKWKDSQGQPPAGQPPTAPQAASTEEVVLSAQGMPDELLTELKVVAQARGIKSLIKAQADPIFVAIKEKFEKDKKQEAASLAASRGAGGVKPKKSISSPGLSREEHMRMTKEL